MKTFAAFALSASLVLAGGPTTKNSNTVEGTYVEARNADIYTGPCYANSDVNMMGNLAVMGWRIEKGSFDGVELGGLGVVGVVRASSTLGDVIVSAYPVQSVLIVDEKASAEQR